MCPLPTRRTILLHLGEDESGPSLSPVCRPIAPAAANRLGRWNSVPFRPGKTSTWRSVPVWELRRARGFFRGHPRPLPSWEGWRVREGRQHGSRCAPRPHRCDRPPNQSRRCSGHSNGQAPNRNPGLGGNVCCINGPLPPAQKLLLMKGSPLLAASGIAVAGVVSKDSVPAGRAEWKVLEDFHPQAVPMPTPATT